MLKPVPAPEIEPGGYNQVHAFHGPHLSPLFSNSAPDLRDTPKILIPVIFYHI